MRPVSPPRAARSILIVESEFLLRLELEQILQRAGWQIAASVDSAARAMAIIDTTRFDAALVDVQLGDGFAYAVVDALAAEGIPFIIMTGYSIGEMRQEHRRYTLSKPFPVDELVGCLDQLAA
jgi:DNA-binding NtrC family response regulator